MSAPLVQGTGKFDGFESSFSAEDVRRIEALLEAKGRVARDDDARPIAKEAP